MQDMITRAEWKLSSMNRQFDRVAQAVPREVTLWVAIVATSFSMWLVH